MCSIFHSILFECVYIIIMCVYVYVSAYYMLHTYMYIICMHNILYIYES